MSVLSERRGTPTGTPTAHTPVTQMSGVLDDQFAVRIVNRDERRWKFGYANREYHLAPAGQPGDEAIVPYLAACLWFGDPRSVNLNTGKREQQYRDGEIQRLSVNYGLLDDQFFVEFDDGPVRHTSPVIIDANRQLEPRPYINGRHPNLPDVAVIDLRDGSEIATVIDDPTGAGLIVPTNADLEAQTLTEQVLRQQEQLNQLTLLLAQRDPQAAEDLAAQGLIPNAPASTPSTDSIAAGLAADELTSDPEPDPSDTVGRDTGQRPVTSAKPRAV